MKSNELTLSSSMARSGTSSRNLNVSLHTGFKPIGNDEIELQTMGKINGGPYKPLKRIPDKKRKNITQKSNGQVNEAWILLQAALRSWTNLFCVQS